MSSDGDMTALHRDTVTHDWSVAMGTAAIRSSGAGEAVLCRFRCCRATLGTVTLMGKVGFRTAASS